MTECSKKDCPRLGTLAPILELRASRNSQHADAALLGILFCVPCAAKATAEDFISTSGWKKMRSALLATGKAPPKRSLTTVRFEVPGGGSPAGNSPEGVV